MLPTYADDVSVVSIHGAHGVLARRCFSPGEMILQLKGELRSQPDRYTIQLDDDLHIASDATGPGGRPSWRYINHACEPNTYVRGRELLAAHAVLSGDELTFNYNTTEYDMASPFNCHCGSPQCAGQICGFRHLADAEKQRLRPLLAPHLLRRLDRT